MDLIRLNANESPYDLPAPLKEEILEAARALPFNRYDPGLADDLRRRLAAYADPDSRGPVTAANIVLGNGSDELILLVNEVFAGPGRKVVVISPSFEMYRVTAQRVGAEVVPFELGPGPAFALETDALVKACRDAAVVFVCRPNNPTGTVAPEAAIDRLLDETPAVVAVDEAYHEFTGLTVAPRPPRSERLVVLRTLSKLFAVAGLRLGYAIAPAPLAERMNQARLPFNVSTFTQLAARVVVDRRAELEPLRRVILAETARLEAGLAGRPGLTVTSTGTNFILVQTPLLAAKLAGELRQRGILVRTYPKEPALERHIRVNAGRPDETDAFLKAIGDVLSHVKA
ncbi:MAG: pyridoxal phosphate-dependent aminotransferase [Bacillota bacterium]